MDQVATGLEREIGLGMVGTLTAWLKAYGHVDPGPADVAVLRSVVLQSSQAELASALGEFIDNAHLISAVDEAYGDRPQVLDDAVLERLISAMILMGPSIDATSFAEVLRRRCPADRRVIRLWALTAHDPDIALRRFRDGLKTVTDRAGLLADARDHLTRMGRPELANQL